MPTIVKIEAEWCLGEGSTGSLSIPVDSESGSMEECRIRINETISKIIEASPEDRKRPEPESSDSEASVSVEE
ncbi:hypothetical protein PSACC_03250 [Paramicrosporidium saccamoebae]|uniref:Uncharacterized protein n=1 Tax=Paramicrosporidium saccamoebae TaxID=1246581 RepID=A0A2H9TGR9_9FUNG|nr:hypothetical protein PSACC_03250 [Paramicrosporidium saccamoebae]